MNDYKFIHALNKTLAVEGGFTTGANQICDTATNMGITEKTLAQFNKTFPTKNFPNDVRQLTRAHVSEIYYCLYWINTRIPDIENERIRNAAFDMNVMSGITITARTFQRALNIHAKCGLIIDAIMGNHTISAINEITNVDNFINTLRECRIASLQKMKNWPTSKNGWTRRTNAY